MVAHLPAAFCSRRTRCGRRALVASAENGWFGGDWRAAKARGLRAGAVTSLCMRLHLPAGSSLLPLFCLLLACTGYLHTACVLPAPDGMPPPTPANLVVLLAQQRRFAQQRTAFFHLALYILPSASCFMSACIFREKVSPLHASRFGVKPSLRMHAPAMLHLPTYYMAACHCEHVSYKTTASTISVADCRRHGHLRWSAFSTMSAAAYGVCVGRRGRVAGEDGRICGGI